ncbi:MAG: GldG family protein [Verrucomicrobiae bacterium]|nr:GldG family protein [Verrucomicrobiae bacterium]
MANKDTSKPKPPAANPLGIGLNVLIQLLVVLGIVVAINYLAARHPDWFFPPNWFTGQKEIRWDVKKSSRFELSDKTLSLLRTLKEPIDVYVVFDPNNEIYDRIDSLLREYRRISPLIKVHLIDKDKDLAQVRNLSTRFKFSEQENIVIISAGDNSRISSVYDIVDYRQEGGMFEAPTMKVIAFKGEQQFTSAIQSVLDPRKKRIYVLEGNGEEHLDGAEPMGYAAAGLAIERENILIAPLTLKLNATIPADCDLLMILGPKTELAPQELQAIEGYLKNQGKLFVTLEPRTKTGLEPLLARYGVKVNNDLVAGVLDIMGAKKLIYEAYATADPGSPITEKIAGTAVNLIFPRARSLDMQAPSPEIVPQPVPRILARSMKGFWGEMGALDKGQPSYDDKIDLKGPLPLALSVEVGGVPTEGVAVNTTKILVVGSTLFMANATMQTADGNVDFLMNSINWLLRRDQLIGIAPKAVNEIALSMNPKQFQSLVIFIMIVLPGLSAFNGFLVWWRRRK